MRKQIAASPCLPLPESFQRGHTVSYSMRIVFCAAALGLSALLLPPVAEAQPAETWPEGATAMILRDGWEYRWGEAPLDANGIPAWTYEASEGWQATSTTYNPPGPGSPFLWLRVRLPAGMPDNARLFTSDIILSFDVYLDSTQIYQFRASPGDPRAKYASTIPRSIALPPEASGRMLYFRIHSEYAGSIGIPEAVHLSSEAGLPRASMRANLDELVLGVLFAVVGLMALLVLFREWGERKAGAPLALTLFALSVGLHNIGSSNITRHLFDAPALWYYMTFAFAFLFPVGLIYFFEQMIGAGYKAVVRRFWQAHLALAVVAVLLDVFGVVVLASLFTPFFILLTVALLAIMVTVRRMKKGGNGASGRLGRRWGLPSLRSRWGCTTSAAASSPGTCSMRPRSGIT